MSRRRAVGVLRPALRETSRLRSLCESATSALGRSAERQLSEEARAGIADSLDLDEALRAEEPRGRRWDYLLGDETSGSLVGIERHKAESGEVRAVIEKKLAAEAALAEHLREGRRVNRWLWLASGGVKFPKGNKQVARLAKAGIRFAGRRIEKKHLR